MNGRQASGRAGERIACRYLENQGYRILAQNWRYLHLELDIVASLHRTLHIVEVKTRRSLNFGYPEEAVDRQKFRNLQRAAVAFMAMHPGWKELQFDIIAILMRPGGGQEILHIPDVYFS